MLVTEGNQFRFESRAGRDPRHCLHHRLNRFAQILIGHSEHRRVGYLWMGYQQVLALLWIDVQAPGNDHEGLAIGEK